MWRLLAAAALLAAIAATVARVASRPARADEPPPVLSAGDVKSPEEILGEVHMAIARYRDVARARAEGFVQISGMETHHGYHFLDVRSPILSTAAGATGDDLDLTRPPILLYVERAGVWQLVGAEYALLAPPAVNPFPGAGWHEHEASCHYRDLLELPAERAADCPGRHPRSAARLVVWHPALFVAHVWAWYPNPDGPFAATNPYLAPWGGTGTAHRRRSAAELVYAEFTHRTAGLALLVIAGVIVWETRARPAFPGNVASSALWALFGLWVFVMSDAGAWPLGPASIAGALRDGPVLQHKALALIPITFGVMGALRAAGHLAGATWTRLVPVLALVGGIVLLLHLGEGRVRADASYLQHAAMGVTAIGLGVALLAARAPERRTVLATWAWPALLVVLALALLLYREG
jgi:hypothetical protein